MKIGMKQEQRSIVQCTVVGDGMVGKSCLSLTFADNRMPDSYIATVFENYAGKTKVEGDEYTVSVFDSAGQVNDVLNTFILFSKYDIIVKYITSCTLVYNCSL